MPRLMRSAVLLLGAALLAGCGSQAPSGSSPAPPGPEPKTPGPVAPTPKGPEPAPQPAAKDPGRLPDGFRELSPKEAEGFPSGSEGAAVELADTWTLREVPNDEKERKQEEQARKDFAKAVAGLDPAKPDDRIKIREAAVKALGQEKAERIGVVLRVGGKPKYRWP